MGTTLQEQLDWLDEAREADADPGFAGRMSALCSLPWTGQCKRSHFVRTNGPFTWAMRAVGTTRFPCGNLPRLLLSGVCTEAVRAGRRVLGKGFRDFMARLRIRETLIYPPHAYLPGYRCPAERPLSPFAVLQKPSFCHRLLAARGVIHV